MPFIILPGGGTVDVLSVPGGYTIMHDQGIFESNTEDGPMARVKYKVLNYDDRYSFVQQLLGIQTGSPTAFVYIGPYAYPPSPNLICTSVESVEPFGKPRIIPTLGLPWLARKQAIVTAVFTRPPYQPSSTGGYFAVMFSGSGEFKTLPGTTFRFADGTPTNTPVGFIIGQAQITVRRFKLRYMPDFYFTPLIGQINNAPFQILQNVYPTDSLLFTVGNSTTEADVFGNITYTLDYVFTYRSVNWNFDYHPNRTTGWALITDGNGNPRYKEGNFDTLP